MKPELAILSLFTASAIPVAIAQGVRSEDDAPSAETRTPAAPTEPVSGISATFWWGDYDGDGLLDAYAIAPAGQGYLLRNLGDGSFEDATLTAGLDGIEVPTVAAWEDFDRDGRLDLFLGTAVGPARLLHNLDGASFEPTIAGVEHTGWDLRAAWIDYDADGLPDLQVRTKSRDRLYHNLGRGLFEPIELVVGGAPARFDLPTGGSANDPVDEVERGAPEGSSTPPALAPTGGSPAAGAPPAAPGGRQPVRPGSGRAAPSPGSSVTPTGPSAPGPSPAACVDSMLDQSGVVSCLNASTIPTYGMLYPLGREFNIDALGNVGMGTTSPSAHLDVSGGATAIRAYTSHGGGIGVNVSSLGALGFAIKGEASADSGTGVYGEHTASTGTQPGVHGVTSSTDNGAVAVLGEASGGAFWSTIGVKGTTQGWLGTGVLGQAQSTAGTSWGVRGTSASDTGAGVYGSGQTGVLGTSSSTDGTGVHGEHSATTGAGAGVHGVTLSADSNATGVLGEATAASGSGCGVRGICDGTEAIGVQGKAPSVSPDVVLAIGVHGLVHSEHGQGVQGVAVADSGISTGVSGFSNSPDGMGVYATNGSDDGAALGVLGTTQSTDGIAILGKALSTGFGSSTGVEGRTWSASSTSAGVRGEYSGSASVDAVGVEGISTPASNWGIGGDFEGGYKGVRGQALLSGTGARYGGDFSAGGGDAPAYGVYAQGIAPPGSGNARGIYAYAPVNAGFAGYFDGDVHITGTVSKGGGSFKIDHPLDPENKYLYHSFVESPEMMNVYNGNAALDENGTAWVELPEWFEALNREFRYQLTAIGAPGPNLYVAEEITGNRFQIAGGAPNSKVSWLVTGVRQDPFAEANRIPVEVVKAPRERGLYLHPEAHGLGEECGIGYVLDRAPKLEKEKAKGRAGRRRASAEPAWKERQLPVILRDGE